MRWVTCDKCGKELETTYPAEVMGKEWTFCQRCIVPLLEFLNGYVEENKVENIGFGKNPKI